MALKYGSKKGGVQLRSGNGIPFKQMGSSPAKQDEETTTPETAKQEYERMKYEDAIAEIEKKRAEETKAKQKAEWEASPEGKADAKMIETAKKTKEEREAKEKQAAIDATKGTHKGQIKKQQKLDKITARRKRKGKEGLTDRQVRLQKEVDMTAEEFVAHKQQKRKQIGDFLTEAGKVLAGKGSFSTSREKATADRLNKQFMLKQMQGYLKGKNKEGELSSTNPTSTTTSGHAQFDAKKFKTQVEIEEERKLIEAQKNQQEQYAADNEQKGFSQTDRDMAQWYKDHPNYKGPRNYKFES